MIDLAADVDVDADGETAAVKIYCDEWEVNLRAAASDLLRLYQVDRASWSTRSCLAIGRSAGMPVFWCAEGDKVTILIGHDEETWDIAINVPLTTAYEIASRTEVHICFAQVHSALPTALCLPAAQGREQVYRAVRRSLPRTVAHDDWATGRLRFFMSSPAGSAVPSLAPACSAGDGMSLGHHHGYRSGVARLGMRRWRQPRGVFLPRSCVIQVSGYRRLQPGCVPDRKPAAQVWFDG